MGEDSELPIAISVSKPEHQGSGRSRFTDYLVTTTYSKAESLVRRPAEDFEWLQKQLVEERAGIIVPVILPPKKVANPKEKFEDDYVRERQHRLNRFLNRIVSNPDLVGAPSLFSFCTANPTDWKTAKENAAKTAAETLAAETHAGGSNSGSSSGGHFLDDPNENNTLVISAEVTPPQAKKRGLLGKWLTAKKDNWALRNKNLVLEETPSEAKKFQDMQEYSEHLETCIRILAEDSKELIAAYKAQAEKVKTMGAAFTQLWGEHELSNTSASTMYQTLGDCWSTICKQLENHCKYASLNLDSPLEELVLDVVALKDALAKRKAVVYDYTKKAQEQRRMQAQLDNLKGAANLNTQSDQFFEMERALRAHDAAVLESQKVKELVSSRLERDVERFRIDWHERMRQVLHGYHKAQLNFLQDQSNQLHKTMPTLSQLDANRAALPTMITKTENPELVISYTTAGAKASFHSEENLLVNLDDHNFTTAAPSPSPLFAPNFETTAAPPPLEDPPMPDTFSGSSSFDSVNIETEGSDSMGAAIAPPPASAPPPPPPFDSPLLTKV